MSFNYTTFFDPVTIKRVKFFHGRLDAFLRLDTRELMVNDPRFVNAATVPMIVELFQSLRLGVINRPALDMPAIVPPTSFKPVMSRVQLRTWLEVDELLQAASRILTAGYSFATADEHFNDLLRHISSRTRILILDPDALRVGQAAARILGVDPGSLVSKPRGSWEVYAEGRLTAVAARAEDVTPEMVEEVLPP